VYEVGPGEGIITRELAKVAAKVIAIEKDVELANHLKAMFKDFRNVEVHEADFLKYDIKEAEYKIFSNIPFNITSEIMRKILYTRNPPIDSYLVMQEEAANKFYGHPYETEFSVLVKPWFDIIIVRKFRRTDFIPVPAVDVVLLNVRKREKPLVPSDNSMDYKRFVKHGYEAWKKSLRKAYENVFTYEQWKRMARELDFPMDATPTQITYEQWIGLFERFLKIVPPSKRHPLLKK